MQIVKLAKHLLHLQVFRYFISAGTATMVDLCAYTVSFYYVFHQQPVYILGFTASAYGAALVISSTFGLITNFLITKYFVFTKSNIKGHVQFLRYLPVATLVILANYALLKVLIEALHWHPIIARGVSAVTIGIMSFTIHRVFSFQIKADEES